METINHYLWQLLAAIEFLIIILLILRLRIRLKNSSPDAVKIRKSKNYSVDMDNLMSDLHLSGELYKELSRKCHPDRYAGTEMEEFAEAIFKLIQQHKTNYRELVALKERAINELKIKMS